MCLCVCKRFIIIMFLTTLCLQLMSCVQVFVPPLLWTLRRIQTNRLDLTEQYEFRQNVISSQVFCLTSADNKKPPPMSTVHTHTGWDWPSGHSRHQAVSGAGQETSDNHRLPRCSFVQQSSKWQDRTFNAVHPAFYRPQWVTGELTHTKILAVAIKHFQPGAWEGARVWDTEEREGCKLWTPVTPDLAAFLKLLKSPVILFSLSLTAVSLLQVGGQRAGPG